MKKLLILVVVLAMAAAACGDDDSGDESAAIASLQSKISSSQSGNETVTFGESETLCMAEGIVGLFGVSRIIEADDQEFEDFMAAATKEERRGVVDLTLECGDFMSQFTGPLVEQGISEDAAKCIGDEMLASDPFRDVIADGLATGSFEPTGAAEQALMEVLLPVMFGCLSPEELANLG